MRKALISLIIIVLAVTNIMAVERKEIKDVDTDKFITDTQIAPEGAGDNHVVMCWWVPIEFWQSIFARDTTTSDADKQAMFDAMSGVSLLAVAQADISTFGAFAFYSKSEIEDKMSIDYTGANGEKQKLLLLEDINPDLEILLSTFKTMFSNIMGSVGSNMHIYVLNDKTASSERLVDPYKKGLLSIQLEKKNGDEMNADIEMPLNSLYIPRKCPNGKDAHVSWNYCPWTGEKLPD